MISPVKIYKKLFAFFGPQGWWPVTPAGKCTAVYRKKVYKPRNRREAFEVCIGAVLTQNCSWRNASKGVGGLVAAGITTPQRLIAANPARLRALVKPSGYYVQKEKKLRFLCEKIVEAGSLEKLFLRKDLREELLSVWGIGPETADSIVLYAAAKPVFVADAYLLRLSRRFGWGNFKTYSAAQAFFENSLPRSVSLYNEYHALIVALGKDFCRKKKPLCDSCPLSGYCAKNFRED